LKSSKLTNTNKGASDMGSNSDAIRSILIFAKNNRDNVTIKNNEYINSIQMLIDDKTPVGNPDLFFPTNRLRANRMNKSFLEENGNILDYFSKMTRSESEDYYQVWITTSYVPSLHKYFLDLSFE
jgi:hypothetical protein